MLAFTLRCQSWSPVHSYCLEEWLMSTYSSFSGSSILLPSKIGREQQDEDTINRSGSRQLWCSVLVQAASLGLTWIFMTRNSSKFCPINWFYCFQFLNWGRRMCLEFYNRGYSVRTRLNVRRMLIFGLSWFVCYIKHCLDDSSLGFAIDLAPICSPNWLLAMRLHYPGLSRGGMGLYRTLFHLLSFPSVTIKIENARRRGLSKWMWASEGTESFSCLLVWTHHPQHSWLNRNLPIYLILYPIQI